MILIAASILLLFYNKPWMRIVGLITWLIGLVVSLPSLPLVLSYLISSAIFLVIWLIIRAIINHIKKKKEVNHETHSGDIGGNFMKGTQQRKIDRIGRGIFRIWVVICVTGGICLCVIEVAYGDSQDVMAILFLIPIT